MRIIQSPSQEAKPSSAPPSLSFEKTEEKKRTERDRQTVLVGRDAMTDCWVEEGREKKGEKRGAERKKGSFRRLWRDFGSQREYRLWEGVAWPR